uniref:PDR_CDR domain-containing protein n=1 Tax=Schistosoma curassoni TaxID=6186 RepID=A0A183KYI2_9TREM
LDIGRIGHVFLTNLLFLLLTLFIVLLVSKSDKQTR